MLVEIHAGRKYKNNVGRVTTNITISLSLKFKFGFADVALDTEAASVNAAWQFPVYLKEPDNNLSFDVSLASILSWLSVWRLLISSDGQAFWKMPTCNSNIISVACTLVPFANCDTSVRDFSSDLWTYWMQYDFPSLLRTIRLVAVFAIPSGFDTSRSTSWAVQTLCRLMFWESNVFSFANCLIVWGHVPMQVTSEMIFTI